MSIHEFMHDSYFTNCLITNYIESVKLDVIPEMVINQFDYKAKNYPLTFRQRTKVIDSTNRKIKDYLKRENTNDPFKVAKSINDLYGCRIVLNGVNINSKGITKLLSNLRNKGIIYRYYHRDDHGYKAFHCYFQNRNIYFPWELQIWDKSDRAMNVNLHKGHALRRKKRLEA